ncbi:hypothetical protein [Endozoicomonas sp. ALB032]|uniref:hypothetical protein n=1 Tax=Endozoicomonas sp. ALB032 TaxID=3403082 RepID=UPI003BB7D1B8
MFKHSLLAALLLLLSSSVTCQAQWLTERYIVELQQNVDSSEKIFSIKRHDRHTLPDNPSITGKTNSYALLDSPTNNLAFGPDGYWLKKTIIESISWNLLFATHLLVAFELILTTHDTSPDAKTYSQLPLAFIAVGSLLSSYWISDLPMFNPIGQPEASKDHPFAINTMMLSPEDNSQQGQLSTASTQQASGTTIRLRGTITSHPHSDSGEGNGDPEQQQHTFDLNCHADNCNGVCKFRKSEATTEQGSGLDGEFDPQSPPSEAVGFSLSLAQSPSTSIAETPETQPIKTESRELSYLRQTRHATLAQIATARDPEVFRNGYIYLLCEEAVCGERVKSPNGTLQPCGMICGSRQALVDHFDKFHNGWEKQQGAGTGLKDNLSKFWQRFCAALSRSQPTPEAPSGNQNRHDLLVCGIEVEGPGWPWCTRLCMNPQRLMQHRMMYHGRRPASMNQHNPASEKQKEVSSD